MAAPDLANASNNVIDPASRYVAVTPSDSTDLEFYARGFYIGGAGNLVAVKPDGTTCTFTAVNAGTILPIRAVRINSTNTTATSIVALG